MIYVIERLKIPIYGGKLIIVVSDSDSVYDACKEIFGVDDPSTKTSTGVTLSSNPRLHRDYPVLFGREVTPGLAAHEAKHIVNSVFKDVGVRLSFDNDEHECYFLSWVVNRIWEVKLKFDKKIENEKSRRAVTNGKADESSVN